MILRRLGNKSKIAQEIQRYFPPHTLYIEPFFGAWGLFFNKPKAKYNILNDADEDVYNLYKVIRDDKQAFIDRFILTPVHQSLYAFWKLNKESDPVSKAVRFVFCSNFTYMGKPGSLRFNNGNSKQIVIDKIDDTVTMLMDCEFGCKDFKAFLKQIPIDDSDKNNALIYSDPPYLSTTNNYSSGFSEKDSNDLFDCMIKTGVNFAMSEFDHPFILQQAKKRGLYVHEIGERQNMKNRRTEILITNYRPNLHQQQSMF